MAVPVDNTDIMGSGNATSYNNSQYKLMTQDARWRMLYPAPYFDPIAMQTLMDPKIMMLWGRYFYDWHPIIHAAINKMVSYPITEFIFDTTEEETIKKYKEIFTAIDLKGILIKMGLDYFVSGNSYFSLLMPFKRMLECPHCRTSIAASEGKFKLRQKSIIIDCPTCKKSVVAEIKDVTTKEISAIRPILWDPLNMKVNYDETLGMSEYFYSLPSSLTTGIDQGNIHLWATYPLYLINAAQSRKYVKLYNKKVFHLKRETHSSAYNKGYGQPIISPVLKYLFHLLILLRAQDALAIDQILPWTIISPSSNGAIDPAGDLNLGQFSGALETEYKQWKANPLRKSIMPVPVNAQILGAQGKALMLTNEIQEITNQILAGMSVPNEFVYGGLQWSGANVSLRMLENQFINYRTMMQEVIDYIIDECHTYFDIPKIKVRMQPFKMADDIAQKDLLLRLVEAGVLSKHTALKELFPHLEYEQEQKYLNEEEKDEMEKQVQRSVVQNNVQRSYGIMTPMPNNGIDMGGQQHGDLPEQRPPRAEGGNQQV
jgi:hypothetical protein